MQNALEFSHRCPSIAQKDHNDNTEARELVAPKTCLWGEPEMLILSAEVHREGLKSDMRNQRPPEIGGTCEFAAHGHTQRC